MTKQTVIAFLLPLALFGYAACGGSESAICDDACDCEGCSDREYDDCLDDFDDTFRRAENTGCEDIYDDWVVCLEDTGRCDGGYDYDTNCKPERDRLKNCLDDDFDLDDDIDNGKGKGK